MWLVDYWLVSTNYSYISRGHARRRRSELQVQVDVAVPKAYVPSPGRASAPPASGVILALRVDRGSCDQLTARGLFLFTDFENSTVALTTDLRKYLHINSYIKHKYLRFTMYDEDRVQSPLPDTWTHTIRDPSITGFLKAVFFDLILLSKN